MESEVYLPAPWSWVGLSDLLTTSKNAAGVTLLTSEKRHKMQSSSHSASLDTGPSKKSDFSRRSHHRTAQATRRSRCACSSALSQLRSQSAASPKCLHHPAQPVRSRLQTTTHWQLIATIRRIPSKTYPGDTAPNSGPTEAVNVRKQLFYTTPLTQQQ